MGFENYPKQKPQPKPKKETDGCVVEIKKTKTGKKISFKGKCSDSQIRMAQQSGDE